MDLYSFKLVYGKCSKSLDELCDTILAELDATDSDTRDLIEAICEYQQLKGEVLQQLDDLDIKM